MKRKIFLDVETYRNGFLLAGKVFETGARFHTWLHEDGPWKIQEIISANAVFVTFNGRKFDLPMISAAASGEFSENDLKELANALIEDNMPPWVAGPKFGFKILQVDHVDLMEVAPSFVSLKAYGARMHMPILQELPIHHSAILKPEDFPLIKWYCDNDVDTTEALFKRLEEPLKIRVQMSELYHVDMRSKSDTQMAETAFVKQLGLKYKEHKIPPTVQYHVPSFIQFRRKSLQSIYDRVNGFDFEVNRSSGHVVLPDFLKEPIRVGNGIYQMGVGGLHSQHDKKVAYLADKEYGVTDIDAASFYPSIIIACNLIPQTTGAAFIEEYKRIYHTRLEAKRSGNKAVADTLKISLNGTFGKTASRYSPLYSPDLMIAITMTGQLTLLCLIERFCDAGFEVCSANTDGIAVRYPLADRAVLEQIVNEFSAASSFEFEYTPYRVLAMKDVNNYIAVTPERKIKAKGLYAPPDLRKNPAASICSKAIGEWLSRGTPFTSTVKSGKLVEFLSARNVTGGGQQNNVYLGKVVRWYQTTDKSLPPLVYAKNGNKVPKTDGARALMRIEDFDTLPDDLDYDWYIRECVLIAKSIGCEKFLTTEELAYDPPKVSKRRKKNDNV